MAEELIKTAVAQATEAVLETQEETNTISINSSHLENMVSPVHPALEKAEKYFPSISRT